MLYNLCIHLPGDEYLSCLQFLALVNNEHSTYLLVHMSKRFPRALVSTLIKNVIFWAWPSGKWLSAHVLLLSGPGFDGSDPR